jgi:hypothetical protein
VAGDDGQNSGSDEAHTLAENFGAADLGADPERAAKVGATRAMAEAAMSGLAGQLAADQPEEDQPSLLLADPEGEFSLFGGPVRHVAKIRDDAKRARGRPKGSQNRRSADLANYLLSMGYRDPALNLADIANATPADLAAELGCDALEAFDRMVKANVELMRYFHAAKPQEIAVTTRTMGIMMIGEMPTERAESDEVMDLTRVAPPQ